MIRVISSFSKSNYIKLKLTNIIFFLLLYSCSVTPDCVVPGFEHLYKTKITFNKKEVNDFWKYYLKQDLCKKIDIFDSLMTPIIEFYNLKQDSIGIVYKSDIITELIKINPILIIEEDIDPTCKCFDSISNDYEYYNTINLNKLQDIFHWMFIDILSELDIKYRNYMQLRLGCRSLGYGPGYPIDVLDIFFNCQFMKTYKYEDFILKLREKSKCK